MGISAQRLGAHPQASGMKAAGGFDRVSPQTGIAYRAVGASHKDPVDMPVDGCGPGGTSALPGAAQSPLNRPAEWDGRPRLSAAPRGISFSLRATRPQPTAPSAPHGGIGGRRPAPGLGLARGMAPLTGLARLLLGAGVLPA